MDKLLDTFEHRMEFELSLNATQTAHARQILSDLMDALQPQQPAEDSKARDAVCPECGEGVSLNLLPKDKSIWHCNKCNKDIPDSVLPLSHVKLTEHSHPRFPFHSSIGGMLDAKRLLDKHRQPQQPVERIAKMLQSGDRVRLWYGRRFLDRDCISNDWIVMDSQGNRGLGDCLYSGANLDEALDALEARP